MSNTKTNWTVAGEKVAKQARTIAARILEGPHRLSEDWIRADGLTAAVVFPPIRFCYGEWIAHASADIGVTECFALITDAVKRPMCFSLPVSRDVLCEFDEANASHVYVLFPASGAFAILRKREDYTLIVGPRAFVRMAIGCSFHTNRMTFLDDHINEFGRPVESVCELLGVFRRYERFN